MDKVKTEKVRCTNTSCKKWFNAPTPLGNMKSNSSTTEISNKVMCPHCGKMTVTNVEKI